MLTKVGVGIYIWDLILSEAKNVSCSLIESTQLSGKHLPSVWQVICRVNVLDGIELFYVSM